MAYPVISSLQNHINMEKQSLTALEQQKIRIKSEFHSKQQELSAAGDQALATMEIPGPRILELIRQSVQLKAGFEQEIRNLDSQIGNVKKNLDIKQEQLQHLQNMMPH